MNGTIHQFVHGKSGKRNQHVGVLLGVLHDDKVIITGSKVNVSHGDRFDRDEGLHIAWERQNVGNRSNRIAASMKDDVERFAYRCARYFRTNKIIKPVC